MGVLLISYPQKLLLKLIGKYLLNPKLEKYIERPTNNMSLELILKIPISQQKT